MPKAIMNELFKSFRGKLGDLVFREMPDGTVVVSRAPKHRKRRATPRQKAHRARMAEAADYGSSAAGYYPIYAELAKGTKRSAYSFAVEDWFHSPEIHRIEREGSRILVEATDNVGVTKVRVTVLGEDGQVLDKGEAARQDGDRWEYIASAEGKTVLAEAWDLPGHVTKAAG